MAGGPVSWLSKEQAMVALSTSEAAVSTATQETVWLRRLLLDLKSPLDCPTVIMEDTQGSISITKNLIVHTRTKHIDINIIMCMKPCKME